MAYVEKVYFLEELLLVVLELADHVERLQTSAKRQLWRRRDGRREHKRTVIEDFWHCPRGRESGRLGVRTGIQREDVQLNDERPPTP